jgi:hypothetical protein
MTDIVERLRSDPSDGLCSAAADEIERLRRRAVKQYVEIERLRALLPEPINDSRNQDWD